MTLTERRTKVGVNLLWLVPGVVGGSENYITRLLDALGRAAPAHIEVVLFSLRQFPQVHPELTEQFRTVVAPIDGGNKPLRVAAESSWLGWQARREHIDVMHHAGGRVPVVARQPSVVTIHDLQPLDMPENFTTVKRLFLGRAIPRSAARATVVTAPSEFVRSRVVELLGVERSRTAVVAAPLRPRTQVELTRETPAIASLLASGAPYFVYPAITYPHKNHQTLLHAFARVRQERPDVRLVLTGGAGPDEHAVSATVAALDLEEAVLRTGRVPRGDLDSLLAHATALVFPSRYEGFGLPVLEAMAAGCPVIAADATALPEVVDGVGTLVDPDDIAGWADAMRESLRNSRSETADAERARAATFSSDRSIEALVAAYQCAALGARKDRP